MPHGEIKARRGEQNSRGDVHGDGVGQERNDSVTDDHGSEDAAERADGGETPNLAAYTLKRNGEDANQEWTDRRQKGQGNEKQGRGSEQGAQGQIHSQESVGDFFDDQDAQAQIDCSRGNAVIETIQAGRTIDEPAAEIITEG